MHIRRHNPAACLAGVLALLALLFAGGVTRAQAPQRVAILPFSANADKDISRLAWQDKVTVIEPDLVTRALKKVSGPYNDEKARQIGKDLSAHVVVYGSITALGESVSVDARVVKVAGKDPALTAFVQAANLDQVIPRINDFAQRINAEIFARPEALAAQSKAAAKPDKPAPGEGKDRSDLVGKIDSPATRWGAKEEGEKLPDNISPLNPLFLRNLSGVESDRYWRSPRIPGRITSLAVADIDLDGKNELLALMPDSLRVYRLAGKHFALIHHFKSGPRGEYLFVDAADIDGDGRPEVFVSNVNNFQIESFVLVWGQGGLEVKAKGIPYYFRVQPNPNPKGKGNILLGQAKSVEDAYFGPVYYLKYEKGTYVPDKPVNLPEFGNIYNMTLADLNGSGKPMIVMIGPGWDLQVYSSSAKPLSASTELYGASGKYIPQPGGVSPGTPGRDEVEWSFVPTRIVPTDLDGDGRDEVVVVRNRDRLGTIMERMRMFYSGTIYSMFWNGMSLVENWRTPRISGYLSDYAVADVGNVGRPALVMSVGQTIAKGLLEKDTSHLVAFTLKPQKSKKIIKNKGL
ncbi:MAG: VCBS repeat-containing protein [Desulfarculaceae bacterium]|jgi:TolB-like protein